MWDPCAQTDYIVQNKCITKLIWVPQSQPIQDYISTTALIHFHCTSVTPMHLGRGGSIRHFAPGSIPDLSGSACGAEKELCSETYKLPLSRMDILTQMDQVRLGT